MRLDGIKTEFVMQRARLAEFKKRLNTYTSTSGMNQDVTKSLDHPADQSSTEISQPRYPGNLENGQHDA